MDEGKISQAASNGLLEWWVNVACKIWWNEVGGANDATIGYTESYFALGFAQFGCSGWMIIGMRCNFNEVKG